MKMNINKACDLNSVSVFPPNLRRSSIGPSEPQASRSQTSQQLRSQQSQQSFSQGPSSYSQRSCFSQRTQGSVDELLISDQRVNSQERDHSLKKVSCLPPINHRRDDSQIVAYRSSSGLPRRWSSDSVGESKSQLTEEFEHRFGMMETSLSKFGMMLDSIQSDIIQVNRGTKEVFLETERIHKKLILQDTSLQQLIKEQENIKATLDGGVKSILEELSKDPNEEKLKNLTLMLTAIPEQVESSLQKMESEICHTFKDLNEEKLKNITLMLTAIPEQVESSLQKMESEFCHTFNREFQALDSLEMAEVIVQAPAAPQQVKAKENSSEHRGPAAMVLTGLKKPQPIDRLPRAPQVKSKENFPEQRGAEAKRNAFSNATQKRKQPQLAASSRTVKRSLSPKIQVGGWKTVKPEQNKFKKSAARKQVKPEDNRTQVEQGSIFIDSDDDIDGGFSCMLNGDAKGAKFDWDAEKETERLLKMARRTKRKFGNPIIIN